MLIINTAVIGTQFGDEGKGKIVDFLVNSGEFKVVVRYQGGANAGHTICCNGNQIIVNIIPSGILNPNIYNLVARGVVVDPEHLVNKIKQLTEKGIKITPDNLGISSASHVTLDYHKQREAITEGIRGSKKNDTTLRGISTTYADKHGYFGIRFGEFVDFNLFRELLQSNLETNIHNNGTTFSVDDYIERYSEAQERLRPYLVDEVELLRKGMFGEGVLIEGAQAIMLDIDYGTYNKVTSSSPVSIPPMFKIKHRTGVVKSYTTRVGVGPLPTRMEETLENEMRERGGEYGATTGRPRNVGWLDLPLLRYAVTVGSIDSFAFTKGDVLSGMDKVMVCTHYELDGKGLDFPPMETRRLLERVEPVYVELNGWERKDDVISWGTMPDNARRYIDFICSQVGSEPSLVSWGRDRKNTFRV